MKPLNGNILVKPIRNQTEAVFSESDSRKDLQYASVIKLPPEPIILSEGKTLAIGDEIVYNPRQLTTIVYEQNVYGMIHYQNLLAVV